MTEPQDTHLIWIDLEMTGLRPERDRIIEIATIVTDETFCEGKPPRLWVMPIEGLANWRSSARPCSCRYIS